jgi:hypothetical protein
VVFDAESPRLAILVPFAETVRAIFFVRDVALENLHDFLKPGGIGVADIGPLDLDGAVTNTAEGFFGNRSFFGIDLEGRGGNHEAHDKRGCAQNIALHFMA